MKKAESCQVGWLLLTPEGAHEALVSWFRTLHFRHTISTHILILDSLNWREIRIAFSLAAPGGDFDSFAHRVLEEACLAREAGKVVPSGIPRQKGGGRKRKNVEVAL